MRDRKLIIMIILLMAVGFAIVSANLIMNGGIKIGTNVDGFDVYFSEALLDGEESNKITLSGNRKTITYETKDLTKVDDTSELAYKVKNNSNIYDAIVKINCHTEENEYVSVTANFNGHETPAEDDIRAGEELPGVITARLKKAYAGDNTLEVEIKCEIEARAEEKDKEDLDTDRIIIDLNKNETTYGSEVIVAHDIYYKDEDKYSNGLNERYKLYCTTYQNNTEEGVLLCNKKNKKGTCKKVENETCDYDSVAEVYDKVKFTNQTKRYNFADAGNGNWHIQTYCNTIGEETDYKGGLYYCDNKKDLHDWYIIDDDNDNEIINVNQTWNYDYDVNNLERRFIAPENGIYKLEVWGAQGGNKLKRHEGGYGGYSVGNINLKKGQSLFVNIGGEGESAYDQDVPLCTVLPGGYNGGGNGKTWLDSKHEASGGGATHIAYASGTLEKLGINNLKYSVIIVAGGGGGTGGEASLNVDSYYAGSGGGYIGGSGYASDGNYYGTGGTQSSGGYCSEYRSSIIVPSAFGRGQFGVGNFNGYTGNSSGGGGGYYGGGHGEGHGGFGGGGSGYIGYDDLTNKHMTMYCKSNCTQYTSDAASTKTGITLNHSSLPETDSAKEGNGAVRITYLGQ